jgi:hypothetical protein
MKIRIHSFSDVITNSSEMLYIAISDKGVKSLKELINFILRKAGSDKTADDLFTFRSDIDEDYYNEIWEHIIDNDELIPEDVYEQYDSLSTYKEKEEFENKHIKELIDQGKINPHEILNRDTYEPDSISYGPSLLLIPKDDDEKSLDMMNTLREIITFGMVQC